MTEKFIFLHLLIIADSEINEDGKLIYTVKVFNKRQINKHPEMQYSWKNYKPMKNTFQDIIFELTKNGTLKNFQW